MKPLFRIPSIVMVLFIFATDTVMGGKVEVAVRPHNGAPTIFLNGAPQFGALFHTLWDEAALAQVPLAKEAGVRLYTVMQVTGGGGGGAGAAQPELNPTTWVAPKYFDYTWNDKQITNILEQDPDAYFTVWVTLFTPDWWDEEHMDQMIVFSDGVVRRRVRTLIQQPRTIKWTQGSWASEPWRETVGTALRKYLEHLKEMPWGDRVVAVRLGHSFSTEWYMPGSVEGYMGDYSQPNKQAFRNWLQKKYGNNEQFQKAWNMPEVTFETAVIPSKLQRLDGLTADRNMGLRGRTAHWLWFANPDIFRRVPDDQQVIDYTRYTSELVVETIDYFAKITKDETNSTKIVGAPYGYAHLRGGSNTHLMGKNAQGKMLQSPYLDYQTSPPLSTWDLNGQRRKLGHSMDSMHLHNQHFILEMDHWMRRDFATDIQRMRSKMHSAMMTGASVYIQKTIKDVMDPQKNIADYWQALGETIRIGNASMQYPRNSVSQIAILGDEEHFDYLNHDALYKVGSVYNGVLSAASITGSPYDFYLHEDVAHADFPDYKLYIVTNAWMLTDGELTALQNKLCRNGNVVAWVYAPGYVDGNGKQSVDRVSQLTGIRLRREKTPTPWARSAPWENPQPGLGPTYAVPLGRLQNPLRVRIDNANHPVAQVIGAGTEFGLPERIGPRFVVDDPDATIFGRYIDGNSPALALKKQDDWTSVYIGTPGLNAQVIKGLAKLAETHFFMDTDDLVEANESYLSITCRTQGGEKNIRLPHKAVLYDLYQQKPVGEAGREFTVTMQPKTTYLYYWGAEPYRQRP
jgi:hypothetical protein